MHARESHHGFHLEITKITAHAHTDPPELRNGNATRWETCCGDRSQERAQCLAWGRENKKEKSRKISVPTSVCEGFWSLPAGQPTSRLVQAAGSTQGA